MQAIILAAGKSTRTYPLTVTRPKPLLKFANVTILEHNLLQLKGIVDEIIFIVGFKKEMIIDFVEKNKKRILGNVKVKFIEQKEQLGTGHALMQAKGHTKGKYEEILESTGAKALFGENLPMLRQFYMPKEKNVVFEYDEPKHNNFSMKKKDEIRQNRIIEKIKPIMFIRFNEQYNRLYDIISEKELM